MATAAGDESYRHEILAAAPSGPRVVADVREITAVVPLRSIPFSGPIGEEGRTLWVAGLRLPHPGELEDADPIIAACVAAIAPENYTFIDGVLLYSTPCPAPEG